MIKIEVISVSKSCSHNMKHWQREQIARLERTIEYLQNQLTNNDNLIFDKELKLV